MTAKDKVNQTRREAKIRMVQVMNDATRGEAEEYLAEREAEIERLEAFTPAETECSACGGRLASDGVCADDECGSDEETVEFKVGKQDVLAKPIDSLLNSGVRERTGSAVVRLLERVWSRIRENHPELPEVVIVTGAGIPAGKWGHFRADGWKVREEGAAISMHEMFMAGETLAKGAKQVLQTMLHEAAHTLAKVRGEKDTSRQGRWHNGAFRSLAEEMGLEHRGSQADRTHGFAFVTLTEDTIAEYADLLAELDKEIDLVVHLPGWLGGQDEEDGRGGERIAGGAKIKDGEKTAGGNLKATCGCEEPNIIRLSRKVLDLGVVRCDDCRDLFTAK